MVTETLDKAYLEYSNLTTATTAKEIALKAKIEKLIEGLSYYSSGKHFYGEWENPSGEVTNLLCLTDCECEIYHCIENGSVATAVLKEVKDA